MKKRWRKLYDASVAIICPYCLKPILNPADLSVEHEPPKSRQSELGDSKKIYACKKCNNEKGALTAEEYAEWKRLEFIRNGNLNNQRNK